VAALLVAATLLAGRAAWAAEPASPDVAADAAGSVSPGAAPADAAPAASPGAVAAAELAVPSAGVVESARSLAVSGKRAEAIALLRARLEQRPTDSDARTLLGIVLSWESDYPAARRELEQVLAEHPGHGDALPALIRVELWSGDPLRAEELGRNALLQDPDDTKLLYLHAKAQHALRRDSDALADLDRALRINPNDPLAAELRASIEDSRRLWTARVYYTLDLFDKQNAPWNEFFVSLRRDTGYGAIFVKYWHAVRFEQSADQFEIEAYPRIRPGTYLFLLGGFAASGSLYPSYRAAGDIYQALPWSFEVSVGYRRLGFSDPVDIYTAYVAKYVGDWMPWARIYLTPNDVGTSRSFQVGCRKYFGDGTDWIGLRYGHGTAPELLTLGQVALLDTDSVLFEAVKTIGSRWEVAFELGYARDEQLSGLMLNRFTFGAGVSYRF